MKLNKFRWQVTQVDKKTIPNRHSNRLQVVVSLQLEKSTPILNQRHLNNQQSAHAKEWNITLKLGVLDSTYNVVQKY